jgi:hypothetical protein
MGNVSDGVFTYPLINLLLILSLYIFPDLQISLKVTVTRYLMKKAYI